MAKDIHIKRTHPPHPAFTQKNTHTKFRRTHSLHPAFTRQNLHKARRQRGLK